MYGKKCGKQREAIAPIQFLVKLQPWFLSLRLKTCLWAELKPLVPEFAMKGLPLGRTLWWWYIIILGGFISLLKYWWAHPIKWATSRHCFRRKSDSGFLRSEKNHRPHLRSNPQTSDPVASMITTGPPGSTPAGVSVTVTISHYRSYIKIETLRRKNLYS